MHTWESPKGLSQPEDGGTRTEEVNTLTPPRSRSVVSTNVQTGAKLHEDSRRESLGEDISELRLGGDVENTDSPNSDPFADEVEVNFHVLGALVLDGVGGEVDGADVVAVDEAGGLQRLVQFLQELAKPGCLSNAVGNSPVFGLGAGPRDGGLALGGPRDEAVAEEDCIPGGGAMGVGAASPVGVGVDGELSWSRPGNDKAVADGAL